MAARKKASAQKGTTKKKAAKKVSSKAPAKQKASARKKAPAKKKTSAKKKTRAKAKNVNKTVATAASVDTFLDSVDEKRRDDCRELVEMMSKITRDEPTMWGSSIVGFGRYHYKYASGREGDFMLTGFSPRKTALTLYIMTGFDAAPELMEKLGTFKTGKSCLYVKKLDDVHRPTLRQLIRKSVSALKKKYPGS